MDQLPESPIASDSAHAANQATGQAHRRISPHPSESSQFETKSMEITGITNKEDIAALESAWNEITAQNNDERFYLSYDWFHSLFWLSEIPPTNIIVFTVRLNDEIVAIVPCSLVAKKRHFFTLQTLQLAGNVYSFEKGAIVKQSLIDEVAAAFVDYLYSDFSDSWDLIEFSNVSPFDGFMSEFRAQLGKHGAAVRTLNQFTNVVTDLSKFSDFDDYLKSLSSKYKRKIRNCISKMNRAGKFGISMINSSSRHIERQIDDYYKIYSLSWKKGELDQDFHRKMGNYLHSKGKLRIFTLYFKAAEDGSEIHLPNEISSVDDSITDNNNQQPEGTPIASYYAIQHGSTSFGLKTAYDSNYFNFSPGSVVMYFLTKYLMNEEKTQSVNHQKGSEEYKYQVGGVDYAEYICFYAANNRSLPARLEMMFDLHLAPIFKSVLAKFQSKAIEAEKSENGAKSD